jgi:hypothetical protein
VAEIYTEGSVIFSAPAEHRRCTPLSISMLSLRGASHPHLQFYPEGVLVTDQTKYFAHGKRSAGLRHSQFLRTCKPWPLSIKLEGARRIGQRRVSLLHIDPADVPAIPPQLPLYGRNGVQADFVRPEERELGIIVETCASSAAAAKDLAAMLSRCFADADYPGRRTDSDNIAYPFSPNQMQFRAADGRHGVLVASGTRDRAFIGSFAEIRAGVEQRVANQLSQASEAAQYRIITADATAPIALVQTIDRDPRLLAARHTAQVEEIIQRVRSGDSSHLSLDAGEAYEWSVHHLLRNSGDIKKKLFSITHYRASGSTWTRSGEEQPVYFDIGGEDPGGIRTDRMLSLIADAPPNSRPTGLRALSDMARIIRSTNAGASHITFDIVFALPADYEMALRSNLFFKDNIAEVLGVSAERVIGSYFVDGCSAIKITLDRSTIAAAPDERDVFATQQYAWLQSLRIPSFC